MISLVHISDIHLEKRLESANYSKKIAEERREEVWMSLTRLLANTNSNFFLIVGDLFESEYMNQAKLFNLFNIFSNYPEKNIIICPGNHDRLGSYSYGKLPKNVKIFSSDNIEYFEYKKFNTRIYGKAWIERYYGEIDIDVDLDKSYINILMLHSDIFSDKGYMYTNPRKLESLGFDYIALGHIHKAQKISERLIYSGSLEPLDFSELGDKGYVEVILDKTSISTSFIKFASRHFIESDLYIDSTMDENAILKLIKGESNSIDFQRINLFGKIYPYVYRKLEYIERILGNYFYHLDLVDKLSILSEDDMHMEESKFTRLATIINNSECSQEIKNKAILKLSNMLSEGLDETKY